MGFRKIHAAGVGFFPHVSNSIQPNDFNTLGEIKQKNVDDSEEHLGVSEVQINLIRTERRPEILLPHGRLEFRQQRQITGPKHLGPVDSVITPNEIVPISLVALNKS